MTLKKVFWLDRLGRGGVPKAKMSNRNLQWQQNQVSSRKKGLANYKIIREVESSPYQLFKARRIVDRLFCIIKRIDLSALTEEEKLLSFNEVKVLASLKCQYIVTCYDSFTEGNSLYVVVEYTHMGSLKKKVSSFGHKENQDSAHPPG